MHILIAPNSFKHSLEADQAGLAIREGLSESGLHFTSTLFPIGDGGDGTAALLTAKLNGNTIHEKVSDPLRRPIDSSFGLAGKTAIIELANASGLKLLTKSEYDPLHATTYGTGELILAALDKGANTILLCIGGSATVDGGMGILEALGVKFFDAQHAPLTAVPGNFLSIASIDITETDKRLPYCEFIVLCDVDNYLLGDKGAANVFGPQKGANPLMVEQLNTGLKHLRDLVLSVSGHDMNLFLHGGAAGGVAAGLRALVNARLENGIEYFLDKTEFDTELVKANIIITGEGSIDSQTLQGKAPFGVARRAKKHFLPVIGLAGKVPADHDPALGLYFDVLMAIGHEPVSLESAMRSTYEDLRRTSRTIGKLLSL